MPPSSELLDSWPAMKKGGRIVEYRAFVEGCVDILGNRGVHAILPE